MPPSPPVPGTTPTVHSPFVPSPPSLPGSPAAPAVPEAPAPPAPALIVPPTTCTVEFFAHRPTLFFAGVPEVAAGAAPVVTVTVSSRALAFSAVTATGPCAVLEVGASSRSSCSVGEPPRGSGLVRVSVLALAALRVHVGE